MCAFLQVQGETLVSGERVDLVAPKAGVSAEQELPVSVEVGAVVEVELTRERMAT